MSKASRKNGSSGQSTPDGSRDQYKRHVDGSVSVHGQLETHLPPDVQHKQDTREEAQDKRDRKRFLVEIATLVIVTIYAGFTFWQGWLMRESVNNNSQQFQTEQRPYLWDTTVRPTMNIKPNEKMWASVSIINYGKSPALETRVTGKIFIGDNARKDADAWFTQFTDKPFSDPENSEIVVPPGIPTPVTPPDKAPDYKTGEPYKERQTFGGGGFFTIMSDDKLSQAQVDGMWQTDFRAVLAMRWQYYDAFGNLYWTNICLTTLANGNVPNCPHHNEIH